MSDLAELLRIDAEWIALHGGDRVSIAKSMNQAADKIEELEAAIKIHLREEGFSDEPETVEWWVEQHQPCDIQTTPKDKDDE
jgi:hypothetical protein